MAQLPLRSATDLRFPRCSGRTSYGIALSGCARCQAGRRASAHADAGSAHGGHDRGQGDRRLRCAEIPRRRARYADRGVQSVDELSRGNQRRPDRARRRGDARSHARTRGRRPLSRRSARGHAVQWHVAIGRCRGGCGLRQLRHAGGFRETGEVEDRRARQDRAGALRAEFSRGQGICGAGARRGGRDHLFRSRR